ncbi:MAG: TolC family protein [Ottowia sp.]|nr:TolC family protein [Ottowia sp.]
MTTSPFVDPLHTRPPKLDSDTLLSNEVRSLACPVSYEMTQPLSLIQAVDLALCGNPQIQAAWASIKVQAGALGEARAAYLPTLTASLSRMRDKISYPPASSGFDTTITSNTISGGVTWRLFDFGGRGANQRSAQALLSAALASHEATLQKTLADVVGAYFDAQTARASWQEKSRNESLAQQIVLVAQRREKQGVGAQTDTLQADTALARARLDKSRAKSANQKALAVLTHLIGLPLDTLLVLADDLVDKNVSLRQDLHDWLAEIQKQHPALIAARQQVIAAQEKVAATRSDGLPTIDFTSNVYQNGRPNQSLSPNTNEMLTGLTLNIPLFDGFFRTYKVRGAQAAVEQKKAELLDVQQKTLMDIVKAHADAVAALENLDASKKYLESAQAALDSVYRKFDKGAADMLAILNAQTALSEARQERIRCLADWRLAKLRLFAQAGVLDHTQL